MSTLLAGAGTFVLGKLARQFTVRYFPTLSVAVGLSWLIGATATELLNSIVFLFVKHPFDIGDSVQIDSVTYIIKEIRILSTIMVDPRGCSVQAPNSSLTAKVSDLVTPRI